MGKLPANMIEAPKFDNPIRRTSKPDLAVVEQPIALGEGDAAPVPEKEEGEDSSPGADEVITSAKDPAPEEVLCHRFSVRLTQPQWEALQTRCFKLRLRGEKSNAAELIRRIVDDWIERKPSSP